MKITIAGGGLVGAVTACVMGRRGHEVQVFEFRDDPRHMDPRFETRQSINMALSTRGRETLKLVGLEDVVLSNAVPMFGRMIHGMDGSTTPNLYDPNGKEAIWSVSRNLLNDILLQEASKIPNLKLNFNQKLVETDLESGVVTLRNTKLNTEMKVESDLVIGADGAHSALRRSFVKRPLFNFSQTYIESGYKELCIPASPDGTHVMEKNYLHIWPRGQFMLIGLPNQDGTFTATLFMPFEIFQTLTNPDEVVDFFVQNFPDALTFIGKEKLVRDFFLSKTCPLISVKCSPFNIGRSVLVGDAAHAMVPFYGQGMNAGFEDILVLDDILSKLGVDPSVAEIEQSLCEYTGKRSSDAQAICELAMYNYLEMRHLVNKRGYHLRRFADVCLNKMFGSSWTPLYNSVTFSRMPYSQCIKHRQWQDQMLNRAKQCVSFTFKGCCLATLVLLSKSVTLNLDQSFLDFVSFAS